MDRDNLQFVLTASWLDKPGAHAYGRTMQAPAVLLIAGLSDRSDPLTNSEGFVASLSFANGCGGLAGNPWHGAHRPLGSGEELE